MLLFSNSGIRKQVNKFCLFTGINPYQMTVTGNKSEGAVAPK